MDIYTHAVTSKNNTSILFYCSKKPAVVDAVTRFLQEEWQLHLPHPDVHFLNAIEEDSQEDTPEFSPIQIADVRQFAAEILLTPYQAEQSIFVIFEIEKSSVPAQNALLKILEEPPAHAQIILTTCHLAQVLPTIRSRCREVKMEAPGDVPKDFSEEEKIVTTLQQGSIVDVFALSEKYKDRGEAEELLKNLVRYLHQKIEKTPQAHFLTIIEKMIETQELLQKNINIRLALEECFFSFSGKN